MTYPKRIWFQESKDKLFENENTKIGQMISKYHNNFINPIIGDNDLFYMNKPRKGSRHTNKYRPFAEDACEIETLMMATAHIAADIMIKDEKIYNNRAAFFLLNTIFNSIGIYTSLDRVNKFNLPTWLSAIIIKIRKYLGAKESKYTFPIDISKNITGGIWEVYTTNPRYQHWFQCIGLPDCVPDQVKYILWIYKLY